MNTRDKLILVVDDYGNTADLICKLIEMESAYRTIAVQDGQDALEVVRSRRPDVMLVDIDMPGLGGLELAKILRQLMLDKCPVLIGMTGRPDIDEVVNSGLFDTVLRKPFTARDLLPRLDAA